MKSKTILITGAAGNLGSLSSKYFLKNSNHTLYLMYHQKQITRSISENKKVKIFQCDLAKIETLDLAMKNVDVIIHFAGVLFKASPEKFLPITNAQYFINLITTAKRHNIKNIILISFPHVEGDTSPDNPSIDKTHKIPISVHAKTRLKEEIYLLNNIENPIILRSGMVYGAGVLMPDAMKWLAKKWMLGIWKKPTSIHLISKDDFCECVLQAASKQNVKGIYNIGDDGVQTLQDYLFFACKQWNTKKPWYYPLWLIYFAAWCCELISKIFNIQSPLTKDFIDIGRVSYYGDTYRMKTDLISKLKFRNMEEGKHTF